MPQQTEQRSLPLQTRLMPVTSVDAEKRTFQVCWTRGAQVRRYDWMTGQYYLEELVVDDTAVDFSRFERGLPVLNTHQQWNLSSVLGVAERGWIENGEGLAECLFSSRNEEVNGYWSDVQGGIIRNISVGYIVNRYEKTDPVDKGGLPVWRAIDWTPAEISLVPIGADMDAGVRSMAAGATPPTAEEFLQRATAAVGNRSFACEITARTPAAEPQPQARQVPTPSTAPAADPQPTPQEIRMPGDNTTQTTGANTAQTSAPQRTEAQIRAEEQARITGIRSAVSLARRTTQGVSGLDEAFETDLVSRNVTLDEARSAIFAKLETASTAAGPQRGAAAIETVQDEQEQRRLDMTAAVAHRAMPSMHKLPDTARRYRGLSLAELARRSLEDQGFRTEGMSRNEIVALAMGNADSFGVRAALGVPDFTIALANTVNRTLRASYESAGRTFQRWARPGSLADFRPATRVAVAANLKFEKVNEFGEFKSGKMQDAGEVIQLATYGKKIAISRQAIINDDLDFLGRLPNQMGRAAADFESDTVYGILTANAAMADGTALFHANHANLAAAGAVIGEAALTEARKALRVQTDPSGNKQPLNLVGRYIIVPAALETAAQKQFMAVINAAKTADANVFQNTYEIVTEPRLDANSLTAWYLAADSSQIDTVEYAYLEGEQGLYTEQRTGFDVDGIEMKARLDFAAKAVDWRGLWKNPGA